MYAETFTSFTFLPTRIMSFQCSWITLTFLLPLTLYFTKENLRSRLKGIFKNIFKFSINPYQNCKCKTLQKANYFIDFTRKTECLKEYTILRKKQQLFQIFLAFSNQVSKTPICLIPRYFGAKKLPNQKHIANVGTPCRFSNS